MNVPDELKRVAKAAFAGRPPSADGVFALDSGRNPWRALDDALAAVFEELSLPPEFFDLPDVMAEDANPPELDMCRPVEIDGETIRVRGERPINEETRAALTDVVRATRRRMEAEKAAERAEIEREVRAKVAEEIRTLVKNGETSFVVWWTFRHPTTVANNSVSLLSDLADDIARGWS